MNLDFTFYRSLFWRRLPMMALFVLACSSLGIITAMKLPESFYTTALLAVEAPEISERLVGPLTEIEATEQLEIIESRLMTRANLIDIANRYEVFEGLREMEPDQVEVLMRESTRIRRTAGRNRATLMTLGFEARSGQIAAQVVNEYVTLVTEENRRTANNSAESTTQFFQQEADRLSQDLDRQSALIATFKSENAEALPEDQSYRLGRQTLLQERLSRLERDQTAALSQRRDLQTTYERFGTLPKDNRTQNSSPEQQRLLVAEADLERARDTYSDSHPQVIRLTDRVDRLRNIVDRQLQDAIPGEVNPDAVTPEQALFEANLAEIDNRLEFIQSDIESTGGELDTLQKSISRSSANGIELASLEREYERIQSRYNEATSRLNDALINQRVEVTNKGQRIEVIDSAVVPRIPAGPNRPLIALMGAAAGVGLAAAWFMLLEVLNRSIRRPAEMVSRFNITPITSIPYMESRGRRFARRTGLIVATLAVVVSVPLGLWYIDQNYQPLEIIVQKGLARLGLG